MIKLNIDCLNLVFNELRTDRNSLYSCLLVNKEWCNIVVPILWKENSWGIESKRSEKMLYNTILTCLPFSSKQHLCDIELISIILLKPTLFNYISFCKFPQDYTICYIVNMMESEAKLYYNIDIWYNLEQEIYKLFVSQCKNVKELWWNTSQPLPLFPGALTCFSRLRSLEIDLNFVNSNSLYEMAQICKDLNEININNCQDLPGLISLIDTQRNLKSVTIHSSGNNCKELSKALARKSNTLNYLFLNSVSAIQPSFLTSLINLKKISIVNHEHYKDDSEEVKEFKKYLAISDFPDLQILDFVGLSCSKELATLIERTKGNISSIKIDATDRVKSTRKLIKAIAKNCSKITTLLTYFKPKDFIHVKSLLLNCRCLEHIRFDRLNFIINEDDNIGDELIDILTKFSPSSLVNIEFSRSWKFSVDLFENFIESYRERTLSLKFVYHRENHITKEHRIIISKYINVNEGVIKT